MTGSRFGSPDTKLLALAATALLALGLTQVFNGRPPVEVLVSPSPPAPLVSGRDVIAVLVVASGCAPSRSADLPIWFSEFRAQLDNWGAKRGVRVAYAGVSLDSTADMGLDFLKRFGALDEVSAGRGWVNSGALMYLVRDQRGDLATPQVIILEREVDVDGSNLLVHEDHLIRRYVGTNAIRGASEDVATRLSAVP
jgi:hypothetical protein